MNDLAFSPAVEGFLLGGSLIVAIGAQNAFVLRQGLARRHVFAIATLCSVSDGLLIAAGVAGLGHLVREAPALLTVITLGGAAFLVAYGALAFRRACDPGQLLVGGPTIERLAPVMATCLALTFLNPHVYLDTVVLIGAISARFDSAGAIAFATGAVLASIVWFFGLAYGARLLTPLFARPTAWRVLDILIGIVMWSIALQLLATVRSADG